MSKPIQIAASVACRSLCIPALLCATSLYTSHAFAASALLPQTPAGKLADELIHHINTDTPAKIREWAPTVLSASVAADDKAAFLTDMVSAARDSGGVDVFDVRTDPHQPGMLEVAVKGVALRSAPESTNGSRMAATSAAIRAASRAPRQIWKWSGKPVLPWP